MPAGVFDSVIFLARYPEFSAIPVPRLQSFFDEAGVYLANTDGSPVSDLTRRRVFLNMLTAHIASLAGALSADGAPGPVGRVSSATEGSVSATFEYAAPGSGAWYAQTPYGAAYWQATINLRGFRYVKAGGRYA